MLFAIGAYLRFLIRSTNSHGVQSPFVYNLVRNCFYDASNYPEYARIRSHRSRLKTDDSEIRMQDLGAGSKVFGSEKRKVSQIASAAGISYSRAKLLFRITKYFGVSQILELGTSVGLATCVLAQGTRKGIVVSVEGCPETAKIAALHLENEGISNVRIVASSFQEFLEDVQGKFDLVYFDGNHQKNATLRYFEKLLPTAHNDSIWIFDDIHWSAEMEEAWDSIKKHPSVRVTIDTFQWGIVFFRREQAREDFTIRV